MSKQVTIMTRDLHRLTQNSSSSVTCSKASRYSGESLSKLGSKSTVGKQEIPVWSLHPSCRNVAEASRSYLHSPIHLSGSIINRIFVSSSSSNNTSCFTLSSFTCCCLLSSIFSLLLKYCRPWEVSLHRSHYTCHCASLQCYYYYNCYYYY